MSAAPEPAKAAMRFPLWIRTAFTSLLLIFAAACPVAAQALPDLARAAPISEAYRAKFADCDRADRFGGVQFPIRSQKTGRIDWYGCKSDPSRLDQLVSLPATGPARAAMVWRSKLGLDLDGSWIACNRAGMTDQCRTSLMLKRDAAHPCVVGAEPYCVPVDSDAVAYLVIPTAGPRATDPGEFTRRTGVGIGDYGVVISGGQAVYVVVADGGPAYKIGEGSMALLRGLGRENCAARDGQGHCTRARVNTLGSGAVAIIFPGSRDPAVGLSVGTFADRVKARGAELYESAAARLSGALAEG